MTIRILPPRLANQIAAGEVVERPASVIKELVENSLDAGATQIEVTVDNGGHRRILVRDNGSGIAKDELQLALSRHATSKVAHLDDIESISTLGFRGEALASISSVSRLTLTSKTKKQSEAWLAYAEGREMAVQVKPAAHPEGTTIEVTDLFFNTPARRKFLRAEKTEFHHIDELLKRLAMARFDVGFKLTHNNKVVRNLPRCNSDAAKLKRIGALCGQCFARGAVQLSSESGPLQLDGWLLPAGLCQQNSPAQYTFINGRMIRDKVLTHAIRQAYADRLADTGLASYALYLTLPFDEVDVNVHPAKHEVRFSQARLVHDFVVQAVQQALQAEPAEELVEPGFDPETGEILAPEPQPFLQRTASEPEYKESFSSNRNATSVSYPHQRASEPYQAKEQAPTQQQWQSYDALMSPTVAERQRQSEQSTELKKGPPWQCVPPHHLLQLEENRVWLLDLLAAEQQLQTSLHPLPWKGQPLLLPLSVPLEPTQVESWQNLIEPAKELGIELYLHGKAKLIIKSLPALLRSCDLISQLELLQQALAQLNSTSRAKELLALSYAGDAWQQRAASLSYQLKEYSGPWRRELTAQQLVAAFNEKSNDSA